MPQTLTAPEYGACLPDDCAGMSSLLDEPLLGTAPHAHAWVLVLHPGPWRADAPTSLFDPVIADELTARCDEHRVRTAAIRRPAVPGRRDSGACYVACTRPGRTWVERVDLTDDKELLDLDLAAVAQGRRPGGEPVTRPLWAVCTHGKRDACCASHGRPVQRALSLLAPGQVWEATHLGGHRFAANVLVLPDGLLYGRVDRGNVRTVARAQARGEVLPELLRGRSGHPQPAQAAEWFVRHRTGVHGTDDVTVTGMQRDAATWVVRLRAAGRPLTARVERVATGCARLTGCAGTTADPGRWRLVALT